MSRQGSVSLETSRGILIHALRSIGVGDVELAGLAGYARHEKSRGVLVKAISHNIRDSRLKRRRTPQSQAGIAHQLVGEALILIKKLIEALMEYIKSRLVVQPALNRIKLL